MLSNCVIPVGHASHLETGGRRRLAIDISRDSFALASQIRYYQSARQVCSSTHVSSTTFVGYPGFLNC